MRLSIRFGLLLLAVCSHANLQACDVCGASSLSQNMNLLPQFSKHFVGLQYQYASFDNSYPSLFAGKPNEESDQQFQNMQVWGRYQLNKRIQISAYLPYLNTVVKNASESIKSNGWGDAALILNYSVPLANKNDRQRILLAGLGIKMPTGQFSNSATKEGNSISPLGTGSWDIIGTINYTQKRSKWGYNLDASYVWTTANKEGYKYGNKLSTCGIIFCFLEQKQLKIMPQAGIRYEYSLHDYENYSEKWLNEQTGGMISFGTIGTQFFYKRTGFKTVLSIPLYQHYARGYVQSNTRFEGGIFLLF